MSFKNLHSQQTPLLICNVWDVPSARNAEKLNFQALATSSSAIAAVLGYNDGEEMKFSELEYIVGRVAANTNLPLSVDLEGGYSRDPKEIVGHIKRLIKLGVVGINIEDSIVTSGRKLLDKNEFANILSAVSKQLKEEQQNIFINVRTDPFLLNHSNALEETKQRIELYEKAGADGIFTPYIVNEADIKAIVNCTKLPINVLSMPNLPDFNILKTLGVRRISMGNSIFNTMQSQLEQMTKKVLSEHSFKSIF